MTDTKARVAQALKDAMRARDTVRLSTLRLINAAIKDRDIAARGESGSAEGGSGVSDADILQILAKMVKQRQESIRAYEEGGRLELAEQERAEIGVIEDFLPKQLDDDEVEAAIDAAIAEVGAQSLRDMGKVMAALKSRHTGRMDFGSVGPWVKARLAS
ncbi:MAG: GatB/YqeY domain-containing protein [Pseudomonadota bacterium]